MAPPEGRALEEFPLHVLREYALLADGHRGILVGIRGEFVWMCAPQWDSEPVFSALIGGGGMYAVTPTDVPFVWGGSYKQNTLIWQARWTTTHQVIECQEALSYPADPHTAVVLRQIRAVDGAAQVSVVLDPRAGFGRDRVEQLRCEDDVWTGRCGGLHLRWSGAGPDVRQDGEGALRTTVDVAAGAYRDLVLEISDHPLRSGSPSAGALWEQTEKAWAQAVPPISGTVADGDARHAYAVLRGLTRPGSGMVAAATMCLPERAEAGRNYDYRYAWIRDQAFAGQAAAACGAYPLLDDAVAFIGQRALADGDDLRPAYTVVGGPVPDERALDLGGYPGGSDKVGNWVNHQFQLDAFGEALLLLAAAGKVDRLDSVAWKAVETLVGSISRRWQEADAGVWELSEKRWAHSRLSCVAGLTAVASLAPVPQRRRWSDLAARIFADVSGDCTHSSGRWQRAPDDPRIDAALLLPAVRGGVNVSDPHTVRTLDAALKDLTDDGYMYRFRHDGQALGAAEGAFLFCGFAAALSLHQHGRITEAMRWFERNRASCGPPGLLAEEYDVVQRQIRGNLPQAFVHAMMLETSAVLATDS